MGRFSETVRLGEIARAALPADPFERTHRYFLRPSAKDGTRMAHLDGLPVETSFAILRRTRDTWRKMGDIELLKAMSMDDFELLASGTACEEKTVHVTRLFRRAEDGCLAASHSEDGRLRYAACRLVISARSGEGYDQDSERYGMHGSVIPYGSLSRGDAFEVLEFGPNGLLARLDFHRRRGVPEKDTPVESRRIGIEAVWSPSRSLHAKRSYRHAVLALTPELRSGFVRERHMETDA